MRAAESRGPALPPPPAPRAPGGSAVRGRRARRASGRRRGVGGAGARLASARAELAEAQAEAGEPRGPLDVGVALSPVEVSLRVAAESPLSRRRAGLGFLTGMENKVIAKPWASRSLGLAGAACMALREFLTQESSEFP